MERIQPAVCECGVGLLCCTSGGALVICGLMFLLVG